MIFEALTEFAANLVTVTAFAEILSATTAPTANEFAVTAPA